MAEQAQGGVLGFLDGLVKTAVNASGAAVQTAANLAAAKASLKGASTSDATAVKPTSSLQAAAASVPVLWWVAGGLGVVVLAALLLRRK